MKHVALTKSAKKGYIIAAAGVLVSLAFILARYEPVGVVIGALSITYANGIALRNRHLTNL